MKLSENSNLRLFDDDVGTRELDVEVHCECGNTLNIYIENYQTKE